MHTKQQGKDKACVCNDKHIFNGLDACRYDDPNKSTCPDMFVFSTPNSKWCSKNCPEDKGM